MSDLHRPVAEVFVPLLEPAPYKGAHGGRGSGKSHFFGEQTVIDSLSFPGENGGEGLRTVCIREVQATLKQSAKLLIEDKIRKFGLSGPFKIWDDRIETPGDGLIIFNGMRDHNAESIKSLEGYQRVWIEEAQTLSHNSLTLLRPTIRRDEAEIWASWNPRRETDAIDQFMRVNPPPGSIVVESNWRDNPFITQRLLNDKDYDKENDPEGYGHTWEGEYVTVLKGAYYADMLTQAKREGRISVVTQDPFTRPKAYWDLGGTGAKADAVAIWIVQFIGMQILVLNYYEAVGQPAAAHSLWLEDNGYKGIECVLPHDGTQHEKTIDATYESTLKALGYPVRVLKNQGAGAAMLRVHATRKIFHQLWFNEATTLPGRQALGAYHEKWDKDRNIGLGPEHDWASNGADAFGLMAIDYKPPKAQDWGPNPNLKRLQAG